ncbi:MAG: hypothetical protein AMXMBFR46_25740 [Acidimicrobiia bacterium]
MAITLAETYRLRPGGLQGARAFLQETRSFVEGLGAENVRVLHPIGGGERVNDIIVTMDFADGAAFSKFREAFLASPDRESMLAKVTAADAPLDHVSSLILNEAVSM